MASPPPPSKKNKPNPGRAPKPVPTPVTDWLTTQTWLGETPPPAGPKSGTAKPGGGANVEATDDALALADARPAGTPDGSDVGIGGPIHQGTGSGWLDSAARQVSQLPTGEYSPPIPIIPSGSSAEIDLPPNRAFGEEPSDIFSSARRTGGAAGGSDVFGGGGVSGSDLFPAGVLADPGSNLFAAPSKISTGGESDLFGGAPPSAADRGSSVFDTTTRRTDRVEYEESPEALAAAEITGRVDIEDDGTEAKTDAELDLMDQDSGNHLFGPFAATGDSSDGAARSGAQRPDFNETEPGQSGSNLFGDQTILDMDLQASDVLGHSGVNLLDPDTDAEASGPRSSIFSKLEQASDGGGGGRVDIEEIPLMASSDEGTGAMLFDDPPDADAGPASGIFGKGSRHTLSFEDGGSGAVDFELPHASARDQASRIPYQDSGGIDWSAPLSGVLRGGTLDAPPGGGVRKPTSKAKAAKDADAATETDMEIDRLAVELSGRHIKPMDDESVFSAGDIDPDEFGIPPQPKDEPSDVFDTKKLGSGEKKRPPSAAAVKLASAPSVRPGSHPGLEVVPHAAGKSGGGWGKVLAGLAAGVAVGAAGTVGGMALFGGETPRSTAVQPVTPGGTAAAVPPGFAADAGLIAADPAAALAAFATAGDAPAAKAGRGQARWLARVRAAAAGGQKLVDTDPELIAADAELKAVVDAAGDLPPDEALFAVRSALHRGLIQETLGKPDAALAIYAEARTALPAFAKVFDSAELRVKSMKKNADGSPRIYSLRPADAVDLGGAAALLELATVAELDDEPGFHFWKAVNHAANGVAKGEFDSAIKELRSAKAAHDGRRRKLAGLGLNPLSDPTEQMFLRACDELIGYWTFKKRLYDDAVWASAVGPNGKPLLGSPNAMIDDLLKAKKAQLAGGANAADLAAARAEVKKLNATLAAAKQTAENMATSAADAKTVAKRQLDDATAALTTAKEDAARKATEAAAAKDDLAAAAARLKLADAALDPVIAKLKDAKLIDPKADRPAALAALPDAAKQATVVAGSGDVAAIAKQLEAARTEARKVQESLEAKVLAATKSEAQARDTARAADARVAAEVQKAAAAREADRKAAEERLAGQAEQFRLAVAAARTSATVVFTDADRVAADKATRSYADGLNAYFAGNTAAAETAFAAATATDPADARYWYFLGLARWNLGNRTAAEADFRRGAELESRGLPGRRVIGADLEKVQGTARAAIDAARP